MRPYDLALVLALSACSDSTPPQHQEETPVVATVTVTPISPTVVVGATVALTAVARESNGNVITGRAVTWGSSINAFATVTAGGVVSGISAGTATISATVDGKTGSTTVTVVAPAPLTLTARVGHAMAYDEARHQLLLFGGAGGEGSAAKADRNSLWAWNGTTWTLVSNGGPAGRRHASMVYDASRSRIVLYAGETGDFPDGTTFTDTWEWDGQAWTKRADAGPPSRVHQSVTYDRARSRSVLYGGFNIATVTELRDIWEWTGSAWTQTAFSTASGSIARGIEYDEKTGSNLLFSALANQTVALDRYDGSSVTRLVPLAPCVPSLTASLGATRGVLVYAASCGASNEVQSWIWNGTSWTQVAGTQPPFRLGAAMAYDRDRDRVVLYGGEVAQGVPDLADTWEFDGASWVRR